MDAMFKENKEIINRFLKSMEICDDLLRLPLTTLITLLIKCINLELSERTKANDVLVLMDVFDAQIVALKACITFTDERKKILLGEMH